MSNSEAKQSRYVMYKGFMISEPQARDLFSMAEQLEKQNAELEQKLAECVDALEIYEKRLSKEYKANNGVGHDLSRLAREVLAKVKK